MPQSRSLPGMAALVSAAVLSAAVLTASAGAAQATGTAVHPIGGPALASTGVVVDAPGAGRLPKLSARSFVLADLDTGEILAARNPHGRLRPASTLKVLTAVTLLPKLDPATVYTAQFQDAQADGSKVGVVPDATYTVHNLFQALFLMSGNDAASALANAAGGVAPTVAGMNAKARELGALDTSVRNPSGLDAPGQYSSAYDLALFARAGLERQDFRGYVTTVKSSFPGKMPKAGKARKTFEIYTQDKLLLRYRGAIGVKTGWTTKARGTFVGAATRDGRTLVATVMHTGQASWSESAALLDWGFANAPSAQPVGTLNQSAPTQAASVRHPGAAASGARKAAAASSAGPAMPGWAWVPVLLLGSVVALRTRVLLRRRRRRARLAPPADRRRSASSLRS
jgi:D-alanyl-D-alanine carboxypeptidase (penicillin-binding protein 5/6)